MNFKVYNRDTPSRSFTVSAGTIEQAAEVANEILEGETVEVRHLSADVLLLVYRSDEFAVCAPGAMHPYEGRRTVRKH